MRLLAALRGLGRGRRVLLGLGTVALATGSGWIAVQSPGVVLTVFGALLLAAGVAAPRLAMRVDTAEVGRAADEATILAAYRFFLGREPETPAALAAKLTLGSSTLIAQMLLSDEYEARLIGPILRGAGPSGGLFDAPPDDRVLAWASEALPLEDRSRRRLRNVADWAAAHAAVLSDPRLRAAVPELETRLPQDRTEALAAAGASRGLTAEIEDVGPGFLRGYALDRNAPDRVIDVELWIEGSFSEMRPANLYRRDLEERFGGSGAHGFLFEQVGTDRSERGPLRIEVRDAKTGQQIGARRVTPHADAQALKAGEIARSLEDVRGALAAASGTLHQMAAAAGFTVDTYYAYWTAFAAPVASASPLVLGPRAGDGPRFDVLVIGSLVDQPAFEATEGDLIAQVGSSHRIVRAQGHEAPPTLEGDYAWVVDAGDRLPADALRRLIDAAQAALAPGWLTFDSDELDDRGRHTRPVFRPSFDPDLLLQTPYLGASCAVRSDVLRQVLAEGGSLDLGDRADLWLRVLRLVPEGAAHVPRVLLHRRAGGDKPRPDRYAVDVRAHLRRQGCAAEVRLPGEADHQDAESLPRLRIEWPLPGATTAAVIVPTRDKVELLRACLASLERTRPDNRTRFDLLVVDNGSSEPAALELLASLEESPHAHVLQYNAPFNWSAINNFAASQTQADVLIFLNNDTVAITPAWCDALCAQAVRSEIGAVGAKLLYADGSVQHAGIVLGAAGAVAAHEGAGETSFDDGYLSRRAMAHRSAAVTGACLATRRTLFNELGGFDAVELAVEANDIDYCLRVRRRGLGVLYEPACSFYHYESRSRGHTGFDAAKRASADRELAALRRRWGAELDQDPFYNLHFDRRAAPFTRLAVPPEEEVQGYAPASLQRYISV